MENLEERKESTSESLQTPGEYVQPKPQNGKVVMTVMTPEEAANLLARLQDILSLWPGSDNRIFDGFVMTVLPIPTVMTITKVEKKDCHDKVFCVNDEPVVSLEKLS